MEIALLKDIITKELYNQAHNDNHSSNKRPARLLPQRILYGKGKKKSNVNTTNSSLFCGPPKNCSDLTKLGYTLNGFYLVESPIITNESTTKIETVYCSFRQPKEFNASLLERRVGLLTLSRPNMTEYFKSKKGTGVHFLARRLLDIKVAKGSPFTFDGLSFNLGDGFNRSSGVFNAPKSGVYQFNFKGWISWVLDPTKQGMPSITVYINHFILATHSFPLYSSSRNIHNNFSLHSPISNNREPMNVVLQVTVLLKLGDIIYLSPKMECTLNTERTNSFTGSLLEEVEDIVKLPVKKILTLNEGISTFLLCGLKHK